jgi:hypothetical protein
MNPRVPQPVSEQSADLVARGREYGFYKATWNNIFMKVATTAFQDQPDIVNI